MPTGIYKHKPLTETHKRNISIANTGKKHSKEAKRKMSEYWKNYYANGGLHPGLGKHRSEATKQKIREANTGEKAHNWKGNNASYRTKHSWIVRHFGQPTKCERCGKDGLTGRQIHWHNLSGKYLRDRKDWIRVCQPCHCILDGRRIYFCSRKEYQHQWYLKKKSKQLVL